MIEAGDVRTLRILREKEKWADLPVIVITAHAHDELGSEDVKRINAFASGHRPRYTMEKPVTSVFLALDNFIDSDAAISKKTHQEKQDKVVIAISSFLIKEL